ncbi:hypothetical protein M1567_02860 [Candidatus Marsarchaeota archaeon]|jgi:hypothetical protein|nr:hypothetical protein [Candidatus Marsarchaeota archaeon]
MHGKTNKGSIWKREAIRFGELSIPVWALISILFVSATAATTLVVYNAIVAQVVQPANVLPPIGISLYTGNYVTGTFNTLVSNSLNAASDSIQVPGGNAIIYGVNTINNANRQVNSTLIDIISETTTSNTMFPIDVYFLGSGSSSYVPNTITPTNAPSPLQNNISAGNFLYVLNGLQNGSIHSSFYTYNVPAKSYLNPGSNSITVTNWIGGEAYNSISSNPDSMYYYLLNQSDFADTANTPQVGMPSIPANAFRYYAPGVQPNSVIGFVVPSSYNGLLTFTIKSVASSRALVNK